ncbi:MAG TPA: glycosyltransferase family 39 protein [Desulfatiglandales bacterium]|nr:glycosyltransferase family 39 protein [Desulfatiglandales bacterium]
MKPHEKITKDIEIDYLLFIVLCGLVFLLIISITILASVPPVSKDALVHHLAVPKLYIKHGGMYEIPSMVFSYYPMNLNMLYLISLYFGNDIVPKFIHFSFALLTAWLIFNYLRRRINAIYALLGVIFFLSIPIIIKLSITVYVDLGIIFFSTASLLLLFKWIEKGFSLKLLILSASFCGLAVGTKYNGLVTLFLLTFFVPFLYLRHQQDKNPNFLKAAGYGILFLFIAFIFFSPWMIRNYLWTTNPIFPLYDHWFNPQDVTDRQSIGLFAYRSLVYHETWWQMALLPVRIFFQGQDGNPQYFDGRLNPFLFFLPFFAFYGIRRDPAIIRNEKKIMLTFVVLFFAFAFFSSSLRIRYISPVIPPLVILSIFGVRKTVEAIRKFNSRSARSIGLAIIFVILSFALWLNTNYVLHQYKYVIPFNYLDGTLTRDEYIEKYRFEYPALRYINKNLPEDTRILFIFLGNRGYYCNREYIFDMNNNKSILRQFLKMSDSAEDLLLRLKRMEITHLLISHDIFNRWKKNSFTIKEQELLKRFFEKHVRLLYFKWGYGVSRLEYSSL